MDRTRAPRALLALTVVAAGGHLLLPGHAHDAVFLISGLLGAATVATASAGLPRRARHGWLSLAASMLVFDLGGAADAVYAATRHTAYVPRGTVADLFFLVAYVVLLRGLWLLVPRGAMRLGLAGTLDVAIGAVTWLALSWPVLVEPALRQPDDGPLGRLVLLANPVIDTTVLGLMLSLVYSTGPRLVAFRALVASAGATWISNSLVQYYGTQHAYPALVDAGWAAGWALIAFASVHPSSRTLARGEAEGEPPLLSWPRLAGLALAMAVAVWLPLLVEGRGGDLDERIALPGLLVALIVTRFWASLRTAARSTQAVRAAHGRLAALLEHTVDRVGVISPAGTVTYYSQDPSTPAYQHLVGRHWSTLLPQEARELFAALLAEASARPGSVATGEFRRERVDGTSGWVEARVSDHTHDPEIGGFVVNLRTVDERRAFEQQLMHQALHDQLTGLPNRALLLDRLARALSTTLRWGRRPALVFLDVDRFKNVNDSLGHAAGDEFLVAFAERLRSAVRDGDTVARLGGDEFAVLVEQVDGEADARAVAERIQAALEPALTIQDQLIFPRASLGVAIAEPGTDAEAVLSKADVAMSQAKGSGGGYRLYAAEHDRRSHDRLRLESDLRQALVREELQVHYQPVFDLAGTGGPEQPGTSAGLVAVEALARWQHPVHGQVSPGTFIPVAEQTGLIREIGAFVLREACAQVRQWQLLRPELWLSVNMSALQLADPDFPRQVAAVLADTGLPASALTLEITESALVDDMNGALGRLHDLKALGVRLAVDDFGTGYSSLSYLRQLPVDILKIDRSFVVAATGSPHDRQLLHALVNLGGTLELELIAEGIETEEQVALLDATDCRLVQGFLFGRPSDAAGLRARLVEPVAVPTQGRRAART